MARTTPVIAVALFCAAAHAQSLQLSQSSLRFTGYAGGDSAPPQSIIVTSSGQTPIRFTVSGANNWLSIRPLSATTPARISVSVDPSALSASSYRTTIQFSDPSNIYSSIPVPVTFDVADRQPALDVVPNALRLDRRDAEDTLFVRNIGGGGRFPFTVSVVGSSSWIVDVTPSRGTAGPDSPVAVKVKASAEGLDTGAYRAVLRFASPAGNEDVPVSFFVGGQGPALKSVPRGFRFDLRQGATTSITKRIDIGNKGTGELSWTAELLEGSQLVKLSGTSGISTPDNSSFLTFTIENDGLKAGVYYALVRISSPEALNSPDLIPIVLSVRDPAIPPRPELTPAGLFFVAVAGQPPPPPQTARIDASSLQPVPYVRATASEDGLGWLPSGVVNGMASSLRPGQSSIAVNHAGLKPGVYSGEAVYAYSKTDVSALSVTLVVLPAGATLTSDKERSATGCTPSRLALTQSELVSNFSVAAGWPTPLTIRLTDDCGSPVQNGQVVLTYSNGDPAQTMSLSDPRNGVYSATWVPAKDGASVSITARATASNLPQITANLIGSVLPNRVPILFENATMNQFNAVKGAPLAPGTIAVIRGAGLASAFAASEGTPLPTSVNGTRVLVGGLEAPLYLVSDEQIRAQIPIELAPNRQYQLLVSANGALTVPDLIAVTPAQPGLQVSESDSRVIALHSDFSPISPTAPATAGEEIYLYLVGMGQTDPPVPSGAAAPADSLSVARSQPTVKIDGATAEVIFAGLNPGSVGLYQIQLRVPADARAGDLAVEISQGGAQSNPGVLPVR